MFKNKYLKYKNKYLELKYLVGGSNEKTQEAQEAQEAIYKEFETKFLENDGDFDTFFTANKGKLTNPYLEKLSDFCINQTLHNDKKLCCFKPLLQELFDRKIVETSKILNKIIQNGSVDLLITVLFLPSIGNIESQYELIVLALKSASNNFENTTIEVKEKYNNIDKIVGAFDKVFILLEFGIAFPGKTVLEKYDFTSSQIENILKFKENHNKYTSEKKKIANASTANLSTGDLWSYR